MYFNQFDGIKQAIGNRQAATETLTDEQKADIATKLQEAEKFMEGVQQDRASKQPFQDPNYNLDAVIQTLENLKKDTDKIFNRPPPKPKEPEPSKDTEMKEDN